nr:F-box/WD repeat-containing protein 8 isoform X3 [Equus caballus]
MLRTNWKNRKGAVSELEHIPDAVLCDVHSHDGVVIAGYTSGDVRVWDTRTWDYIAPFLESEYEEDEPGMQPYVSFVRINSSLAVAAYEDGFLNIWDLRTGKYPIHRFEHDARIQALALSQEDATVATASAFDVVMLCPNEEGYWQIAAEFEVQKLVDYLEIVPDTGRYPVAVATAGDLVYLLKAEDSARTLHYVYGQPVTCLDVSSNQAAFGVKSLGWVYEGNKILVYSLEAERCLSKLGNALGDFTCVNLRDSPPNLMVSGNMDRRVRIHDLRTDKITLSLSAHQLGVSAVQMDDWKIVSGGEEGLVSVWDYRMNQKLWEVHSRHPVRHLSFNSHSLITANVPYERVVRSADLDGFSTHRRICFLLTFFCSMDFNGQRLWKGPRTPGRARWKESSDLKGQRPGVRDASGLGLKTRADPTGSGAGGRPQNQAGSGEDAVNARLARPASTSQTGGRRSGRGEKGDLAQGRIPHCSLLAALPPVSPPALLVASGQTEERAAADTNPETRESPVLKEGDAQNSWPRGLACYFAIKGDAVLMCVTVLTNLETMMLRERSSTQKATYYTAPFIGKVPNRQIHRDGKETGGCQGDRG